MKKIILFITIYLFSTNFSLSNETHLDCLLIKEIDKQGNTKRDWLNDDIWKFKELRFIYKIKKNTLSIIKGISSGTDISTGQFYTNDVDISNTELLKLYRKTNTELIFVNDKNTYYVFIDRFNLDLKGVTDKGENYYKCSKVEALL